MKRLAVSVALLLVFASIVVAGERRYPFEQIKLDNGMTVISLEDFSCPIIAVQVWYHVGSKDEDPKRQGFAHMFEHMMFRGTDRLGPEEHFNYIRRVGGDCNAYTSFDQTVYVEDLPSNQLELALWLESERMAFLKIDQEGFTTEEKVVEEERRMGLNRPYGTMPEKLLAEIFKEHPYRWSTIGNIPHLREATIDELQAFWDKFYVPNNATLVVVGAAKHADVQALAKKYFGWIPRCPEPPKVTIKEPPQKAARTVTLQEDKGPLPVLGVLFRTVPESHPDQLPLEVLMGVLGGGESSRLYVEVVKEKKIAQVAIGAAMGLEQDGIAGAGGALLPMVGKKKELMQVIKRQLKRAADEPITEAELNKMKNQMRRGVIEGMLTDAGKAGQLGQYAVLFGDAERINRRLDEIDAVTVQDVQRVAKKYLTKEGRLSVLIEPSVGGMLKSMFGSGYEEGTAADKATTQSTQAAENRVAKRGGPKGSAERPDSFPGKPPIAKMLDEVPEPSHPEKTLPNGLKIVVVSNHEVPMVWARLGIKSGAWTEEKPGVAVATMGMLTKGTKTRDAKQLAETLESNAIELNGSADMDTATVSMSAMLPQLDLGMQLLVDIVQNPTFPKDEFDILQQQAKMGLMVQSKTPEYVADRELRHQIFGAHPYARTPQGELEDVDKVKTDELKAWWGRHLRPDNAVIYVAGDITAEKAFKLIEDHLGSWKVEGKFEAPVLPPVPAKQKTHIYIVDRPGSVQSQIRVGHQGITRKDADYFVSRVLGNVFGGSFGSRLNKAIRVEKGLTYGAGGGFSPQRFGGTFRASTFTKTPSTAEAVRVILNEIDKIRSAPPSAEELSDTQAYITGSFPGDRETPMAVVGDLWMIETQGLPKDHFHQFLAAVKTATAEDVTASAKRLMDPDHLIIVVVGEAEKIKADLEKLAPVTVIANAPEQPAQEEKKSGGN
ncbi:MAG TPA: pitrilysin family protein [Phycisphaerae bacterium]|nr:pitrilysin family protein [Phycisphaerae bacterium]